MRPGLVVLHHPIEGGATEVGGVGQLVAHEAADEVAQVVAQHTGVGLLEPAAPQEGAAVGSQGLAFVDEEGAHVYIGVRARGQTGCPM